MGSIQDNKVNALLNNGDKNLVVTDNTTNDVSTSSHGFCPKAPNDTSKFLRGDATWAAGGPTTQNDVTASRDLGSVYQNTTGKPMFVNVTCRSSTIAIANTAYTDDSNPPTTVVGQIDQSRAGDWNVITFFVLPVNYYKVDVLTNGSILKWIEWY